MVWLLLAGTGRSAPYPHLILGVTLEAGWTLGVARALLGRLTISAACAIPDIAHRLGGLGNAWPPAALDHRQRIHHHQALTCPHLRQVEECPSTTCRQHQSFADGRPRPSRHLV